MPLINLGFQLFVGYLLYTSSAIRRHTVQKFRLRGAIFSLINLRFQLFVGYLLYASSEIRGHKVQKFRLRRNFVTSPVCILLYTKGKR